MENNGNSKLLIAIIILLILIIIGGGIAGFVLFNKLTETNKNDNVDNTSNVKNEIVEVNNEKENNAIEVNTNVNTETNSNAQSSIEQPIVSGDSKNAKASTPENPLKLGEWGLASKYVSGYLSKKYENTNNIDVPVRITKVVRGAEAEKKVKDWVSKQTFYKYEDPKAHTEWALIDYEVDLSNVSFDPNTIGTSIKIDSDVKGIDGGSVKYDGIIYILSTKDISSSDYVKEPNVYKGQFIVTLPIGCTEYLIKLGNSYSGAESYFKCE